jgi:hypothetical protein
MKDAVLALLEVPPRSGQGLGTGIHTVEASDTRRDPCCPSPTSAADIDADCVVREVTPREDQEVLGEDLVKLIRRHSALIECGPFLAKRGDRVHVRVVHERRLADLLRREAHWLPPVSVFSIHAKPAGY